MQFQLLYLASRRQFKGAKIPGNPFVIIVFADIPSVRHDHLLGTFRWCFVPTRFLAFGVCVDPEEPRTIGVQLGSCGCDYWERQNKPRPRSQAGAKNGPEASNSSLFSEKYTKKM
jgi:hypothetical protein